jgi:putative DNA primase/helicase
MNTPTNVFTIRTEKPASGGWEPPENITPSSDSAKYPIHALPGIVGEAVREVVEIVKCPPALAANSALSVLAVAGQGIANVQAHISLKPSPLSLYLLSIGESGERKTTADKYFSEVLDKWAYQKQQEIEPHLIKSRAAVTVWKAEVEGIKQAIIQAGRKGENTRELQERMELAEATQPKPIHTPDMVFEDSTPESIAYDLAHKWPSAGILSDEAGVVFGGHGMKADNITKNLAVLNKLWEGGSLSIKRRGDGGSFNVRNVRLSAGLAVQPSIIQNFYETNGDIARGSGFAARFLLAWPETTQGGRFLTMEDITTQHPKKALNLFYAKLHDVLERQYTNAQGGTLENLPTLQLSPDAQQAWLSYFNGVEAELKAGGDMEHYRDIASKSADNAARIAGLFHLFNEGDALNAISGATMEAATQLATWHLYEARRFFSEIAVPTDLSNAIKLDSWLIQYCRNNHTDHIGKREARQLAPNRLRSSQELDKALEELAGANRIRIITEGRKEIIDINPTLLGG